MMRAGWLCLMLVVGCTVPEFSDLGREEPYACDTAHPCAIGSRCVEGSCLPNAVMLTVSYQGFLPKCVRVTAKDVEVTRETQTTDLFGTGSASGGALTVGIVRGHDWGSMLEVTAEAFEKSDRASCDGQPAVRLSKTLMLKDGSVLEETFLLVGQDTDADGFLAITSGGSDCDDALPEVKPGAAELCNNRDDNCDGQNDMATFQLGQVCDDSATTCQGAWTCASNGERMCVVANQWYVDSDGDGQGASNGTPVDSCLKPPGHVANKTDCDDGNPKRYVGAPELCNNTDEDCDVANDPLNGLNVGGSCNNDTCIGQRVCATDGGVECNAQPPVQKYVDSDLDTYGAKDTALVKLCVQTDGGYPDAGYSFNNTDCDDGDNQRFPHNAEKCSDKDENCDGDPFNGFPVDAGCSPASPGCTGKTVCNAQGTATECQALTFQTPWYPDEDFDSRGKTDGGVNACSSPGGGYIANGEDCDDGDPFTYGGAPELCDAKDNDCDGTSDETGTCSVAPTWVAYQTGGNSEDWQSVSLYADGGVWAVGMNSARALKTPQSATFSLQTSGCIGTWNASWADPVSGKLYLGGEAGKLANQDPSSGSCAVNLTGTHENTQGLFGFHADSIHGLGANPAGSAGYLFIWDGASTTPVPGSVPDPLYDVHGLSPNLLFAVGGPSAANGARIYRHDPSTFAWNLDNTVPTASTSRLAGIWVVHSKLAYAVGNNTVLKWDGTAWTKVPNTPNANFTSVLAFGTSSIYITATDGRIYRYNGQGWSFAATAGSKELYDIAGTSPEDLWVVGQDGRIFHWPK
jgi:hypothetical protein